MNAFLDDDAYQRHMRDTVLVPAFYELRFYGRFRFFDGDMDHQNRGIDTVVYLDGRPIYIEEKIVRWKGRKYDAFALETESCTVKGHEKPGWMHYGEADRLLYCFAMEAGWLDCWWLDFGALQKWFWPLEDTFPVFQMDTKNRSAGRVVPIMAVRKAVAWKNFQLSRVGL